MGQRRLPSIRAAAAMAAAILLSAPRDARALQIAAQGPQGVTDVMECLDCSLLLRFTVVTTGVPVNATARLGTMTVFLHANGGDTVNDVLVSTGTTQGDPAQCGTTLAAASRCSVYAQFDVRDADPFDTRDRNDVPGQWRFHLYIPWAVPLGRGRFERGTVEEDQLVRVVDQGVPEPRSWVLMIVGFGAVGGALRRAAGVAGRSGRAGRAEG